MTRSSPLVAVTVAAIFLSIPSVIALAEAEPTVLTYVTHDGVPLSIHLLRPDDPRRDDPRSEDPRREDDVESLRTAAVIVHGGGWYLGDPTWCYPTARRFVSAGYVAIAPQYRLSGDSRAGVTPLDAMKDIRAAFRWVRSHADSLGVRGDRIVGYGWSAGAHLIACAAIFSDADGDAGANGEGASNGKGGSNGEAASSGEVAVSCVPDVMVLSSPAVSLHHDEWLKRILHGVAAPADISPDMHIVAGMPPTLLLQGRTDTVTPLTGTQAFHDAMLAKGNDCTLVVYDGVGHLFTPASEPDDGWPNPDPEVSRKAWAETLAFLERHRD